MGGTLNGVYSNDPFIEVTLLDYDNEPNQKSAEELYPDFAAIY